MQNIDKGVSMQNSIQLIIFYFFAGLAALSALMVISQNNPVRCVLFLVLAFLSSAVLWLLAQAEFLALILVLVYVGAVMTLFLFVVMMLNIDIESKKKEVLRRLPFGMILVALLVTFVVIALPKSLYHSAVERAAPSLHVVESPKIMNAGQGDILPNTAQLGTVLYTQYGFAFEMAAIILLVAIIAAITLTHRPSKRSKQQNVLQQLMTRRQDRLQVVSMQAEKE